MSKDPAFLFYTQDFVTGTMFMTNEQVGIYIRLLCAQHQHGGMIDKLSFNNMVLNHDIIKTKFVETEEGFFNQRLMVEMVKRNKKSNNLSANAKIRWEKLKQLNSKSNAIALQMDMPIEDENENEIKDVIINEINKGIDKKIKHKYGEYKNVLLTDDEYKKLNDKFGFFTQDHIKSLDEGIELKGYKYKSHYLAILKWESKNKNPKIIQNDWSCLNDTK
jgi:uncharacterized protein YdaU (DUF1376 family)